MLKYWIVTFLLMPLMIWAQQTALNPANCSVILYAHSGKKVDDSTFSIKWQFGIKYGEQPFVAREASQFYETKTFEYALFNVLNQPIKDLKAEIILQSVKIDQNQNVMEDGRKELVRFTVDFFTKEFIIPDDLPKQQDSKSFRIQDYDAVLVTINCPQIFSMMLPVPFDSKSYVCRLDPNLGQNSVSGNQVNYRFETEYCRSVTDCKPCNEVVISKVMVITPGFWSRIINSGLLITIREWFVKGGWICSIITLIGLVGIGIFFCFLIAFRNQKILPRNFEQMNQGIAELWKTFFDSPTLLNFNHLFSEIQKDKDKRTFLQEIYLGALYKHMQYKYHWTKFIRIESLVDGAGEFENLRRKSILSQKFYKKFVKSIMIFFNLDFFWNMSGITPMLGLLGTVTGIADSFNKIALTPIMDKSQLIQNLSGGINEALYTTIFGLAFGIPLMMIYYLLKYKIDQQLDNLSDSFNQFIYFKVK